MKYIPLRTPLIIRAPWKTNAIGKTTTVLAEAVDFYPTLATLVGLPAPQSSNGIGTPWAPWALSAEKVLVHLLTSHQSPPVFDDPDLSLLATRDLKTAAFSQFAKPSLENPFAFWPTPARDHTNIMGERGALP
eukprot:gene57570-biopygen47382